MKVIWLLILVVIASCTLPETNTISPKFNVEIEMLTSTLKGLLDFEDVEIETQVTQTGSYCIHSLVIELINPSIRLYDDMAKKELAKNAALLSVNSIDNYQDYDQFIVKFTQRRIIGDFSKKTWEEEILTLEDLKLLVV
jgi:hypothetical protein